MRGVLPDEAGDALLEISGSGADPRHVAEAAQLLADMKDPRATEVLTALVDLPPA